MLTFNQLARVCSYPVPNGFATGSNDASGIMTGGLGLNNLKRDPLETQHPKFENSRLGFIESVHER